MSLLGGHKFTEILRNGVTGWRPEGNHSDSQGVERVGVSNSLQASFLQGPNAGSPA